MLTEAELKVQMVYIKVHNKSYKLKSHAEKCVKTTQRSNSLKYLLHLLIKFQKTVMWYAFLSINKVSYVPLVHYVRFTATF